MAQMLSSSVLDFRKFNIWKVIDEFDHSDFFNNLHPSVDGSEIPGFVGRFEAEDLYGWWNGAGSVWNAREKFLIAGDGMVFDANENAKSGTITGLFLSQNVNGKTETFDFAGFEVGAVKFQQVAMSRTNGDDIAMLKSALAGADRITGSQSADFAYGGGGNDKLFGLGGNDTLGGNAGNDLLVGSAGADRLDGGAGADTLTGGAGRDRFVFVEGEISNDRVTDFQNGVDTLAFDATGSGGSVAAVLADARNINGGVRFDLDGDVLFVMGVTKAELSDQVIVF